MSNMKRYAEAVETIAAIIEDGGNYGDAYPAEYAAHAIAHGLDPATVNAWAHTVPERVTREARTTPDGFPVVVHFATVGGPLVYRYADVKPGEPVWVYDDHDAPISKHATEAEADAAAVASLALDLPTIAVEPVAETVPFAPGPKLNRPERLALDVAARDGRVFEELGRDERGEQYATRRTIRRLERLGLIIGTKVYAGERSARTSYVLPDSADGIATRERFKAMADRVAAQLAPEVAPFAPGDRATRPEIDAPGSCSMCRGSGMVAVGPWGSRPPRVTCDVCGGSGWEPVPSYDDAIVDERPHAWGMAFTTSDGVRLVWEFDMGESSWGYVQVDGSTPEPADDFACCANGEHDESTETVPFAPGDDDGHDRMIAPELDQVDGNTVTFAPVTVMAWRGTDGALVVQVDTDGDVGRLRLNVNDAAVWDQNPETGETFGLGE